MAFAIVVSAVFAVVFLLSCFSAKRIRLAIQIIKEASKAIRAMPLVVFLPVFKYIALALLFGWFVYIMALLSSSGTVTVTNALAAAPTNNVTAKAQALVSQYSPDKILSGLQIYYFFGLLWTMNWIIGIGQCTIAGAVATWYWTRDKRALPGYPVFRALARTVRYHLGSVAFGALTIAVVQMVRFVLSQVQARVRGSPNKVALYAMACLQCCFACLEKLLKFINKNAYIMVRVGGGGGGAGGGGGRGGGGRGRG
ncbi:MAG: choline transporter-like protein, partial [Olpidium bornovanus]